MGQITDPDQQQQQAPGDGYCIPVERRSLSFHVLAAGDSITQGSVPSRGFNYPYTIKLEELLRKKLGPRTRAIDAGGCTAATVRSKPPGRCNSAACMQEAALEDVKAAAVAASASASFAMRVHGVHASLDLVATAARGLVCALLLC
jgi:hypothetical protein